jgi:phytoene dehydrogenase-like protein
MARADYDAIVIGAGHNGLTCACYLAAGGMKVCIVERRNVVGGAAVTEEFHPGFRNSTASYTVSLLNPKVIRELRLAEHGLRIVERPFSNFLPLPDGDSIRVGGGVEATQREVARFSKRSGCPRTTTGSIAWPTCCASCCWRRLPTWAAASPISSRRGRPAAA